METLKNLMMCLCYVVASTAMVVLCISLIRGLVRSFRKDGKRKDEEGWKW